jgi:anti-sigma factor RsiW
VHITETQLANFAARRLAAEELSALTRHLSDCAVCRQRAATQQPALHPALHDIVLAKSETVHLTFEQLADWVDGRLSGETQQFARDHLSHCQQCGAAADDLRAFSREVADELAVEQTPATRTAPSWSERLRAFLATPLIATATAVALLIFGLLGWRMFNRNDQQVVIVTASPTPVVEPTATVTPTVTPPNLLAQLNDGGVVLGLDATGNLQGAEAWPLRYRQLVAEAWQTSRLPRSTALNGLGSAAAALMGTPSDTAFHLLAPIKQVVATDRPTLRWQPLAGAESYEVEIVNEQYEPVLTNPALTTTVWQVPEALPRGRVYAWQVKALKDGQTFKAPQPPAPLARFRIIGQKEFAEIQTAKARYGTSHLLLGQLYAEAGLLEEAEREFRALQQANPDSPIPTRLLAELRKLRR